MAAFCAPRTNTFGHCPHAAIVLTFVAPFRRVLCIVLMFINLTRSARSPPGRAPGVAFLVGGAVRGFDRERVVRAFVQHVVQPLSPEAAVHDVFLALKVLNQTKQMAGGMRREIQTDLAALDRSLAMLKPLATHLSLSAVDEGAVLRPASPPGTSSGFTLHPGKRTCFGLMRVSVQGFVSTMRRSLLLMADHERAVRRRYDVVVFSRPDLLHTAPLPRWCHPRWEGVISGAELRTYGQDFMFVLPRRAASALMGAIEHTMTTYAAKGKRGVTCTLSATETLGHLLAVNGTRLVQGLPGHSGRAGLVRSFAARDPSCPKRPAAVYAGA